MSDPDYRRDTGPVFNQPDGVQPYAEEQTLPFVDLYPPSDNMGGAPAHGADDGQWNPGPYGAGSHSGQQYPPQQHANPPYQPNPQYNPNPQQYTMATAPQQQWGYRPYALVEHPQSTTVLVLALVGFAVPVTSFVAWYMGSKAKAEIDRGAPFPYSGSLKTGHIIGKVVGILTIVGISVYALIMVFYVILMLGMFASI